MIAVGHLRAFFLYTCLMNFSSSPFFNLLHRLLQLAVMEAIRERDGKDWSISSVCLSVCLCV